MSRLSSGQAVAAFAVVLTLVSLTSCGDGASSAGGRLQIATAFYPIAFIASRLGGDLTQVANLTPPGAEPHDLELRPSDIRLVRTADLILYFGRGFQPSLENALDGMPDKDNAIDLLGGLSLRPAPRGDEDELSVDPHAWLSPPLMKQMVASVERALSSRLRGHQAEIATRAAALSAELDALDREFTTGLAHCRRREVFASHTAFGYLAAAYGLTQVPIAGLSPEAEPSARRLQDVARAAEEGEATTIYFETLVSPRVANAVARIVGAKTAVLDPIEGLSEAEMKAGKDYFSVMRENLAALSEGLGCAA